MVMGLSGLTYQGSDAYNMAPTETVEVLRRDSQGALELVPMRWWLTPSWAKTRTTKYAMFNARCETAAGSAAFKLPYRTQRCVVPISGVAKEDLPLGIKVRLVHSSSVARVVEHVHCYWPRQTRG
jgi:putative SOS response-associated peptidase YedK